ncbi:MAG: NADH:ubiquinone reductase (Na(+)-transporting) subunit C [Bacteroidales bacterium]|nr:NADH:ubiquinone reductase (Na(+)-transporting) subunit C [Bacteroidales bacterium]
MNKNSNTYIFIYASLMVVIVAVVLTMANLTLKPLQQKNVKNEKMTEILSSIGIEANAENAEQLFNQYIREEIVITASGEVVGVYRDGALAEGTERAFDIDLKKELNKQIKTGDGHFPMYIADNNGERLIIIPLLGKGLWAKIWGNIALKSDLNTIYGANFGHESETPGLGAEISEPKKEGKKVFSDQYDGKQIFDAEGNFQSIICVKGGVANQSKVAPEHGVDAISGGTLTSNGVTDMINDCLVNYVEYIKKNK